MSKAIKPILRAAPNKVLVCVLGCKVNQAEAAAMSRILEDLGYEVDSNTEDPALILVNTCCVTSRAEGKSRRTVSRLASRFPNARVVVTGCLAEVNPASLRKVIQDPVILGTYQKDRFRHFIGENGLAGTEEATRRSHACETFGDLGTAGVMERARAFLKVQDGCSQHCTYCIVPRARGPARSLPVDTALAQARDLSDRGYAEIVLTGIHLGSYGKDLEPRINLETLIGTLLAECGGVRFRLSSVEPQEISEDLIRLAADHPRVCRHFHIPVQSGDNGILARMRRPYRADRILRLTDRILSQAPEACIGMDVMVGFPGEDDNAFDRTVNLVEASGAAYLHVFPFSPRAGTPAASYAPRVPPDVAAQRVQELRAISRKLRHRFYSHFVGRTLEAVLESEWELDASSFTVRTDNYIPVRVNFSGSPPAIRAFPVTVTQVTSEGVAGSCVFPG